MTFTDADRTFMRRALALADKAKGTTFPNPAVGAVVVNANGNIVGEGATGVYGGPHAEKRAIKKAGAAARGAAMYVTLEPCSHFGKTPPCTDAIIEAGIRKVVAAVKDPNPLVAGKGFRQLRKHGIEVSTGLLAKEAVLVNEDFFFSIVNKRPWVSLKLATTLDGKIADCQGGSKWITSEAARREVQDIRRRHAAIAVGKNTLILDDPKLTARCKNKTYYPARIVFCTNVRDVPPNLYLVKHASLVRTILVTPNQHDNRGEDWRLDNPEFDPMEIWRTGRSDGKEHIDAFLKTAYAQGINSILVEGGQRLASGFLEHGFVNKLYLFYGDKIFGSGKSGLRFSQPRLVTDCVSLDNAVHKSFGDNFLISGYPRKTGR